MQLEVLVPLPRVFLPWCVGVWSWAHFPGHCAACLPSVVIYVRTWIYLFFMFQVSRVFLRRLVLAELVEALPATAATTTNSESLEPVTKKAKISDQ